MDSKKSSLPDKGSLGFWRRVSNRSIHYVLIYKIIREIKDAEIYANDDRKNSIIMAKLKSFVDLLDIDEAGRETEVVLDQDEELLTRFNQEP